MATPRSGPRRCGQHGGVAVGRILLVDDDVQILRLLERTLLQAGYRVQAMSSGRQALAALRAAPVDLLITDIIMPDQEGLETITEARRIQPDLRVIGMSGGGFGKAQDYLKAARLLGAIQTLQKPFSSQDLLTSIAVALGSGDRPPPSS